MLLHWEATDPNQDELTYRVYLRGEDQTEWKLAEENINQTSVLWDTFTMPEGITRLLLVASDAPDNPPSEALEVRRLSQPFVLDNSPPLVEVSRVAGADGLQLRARFTDSASPVLSADFSVDYDTDQVFQLQAVDGLFDSASEEAVFRPGELPAGEHVVVVRAWDQADNVGVGQLVIQVR